MMLSFQNLHQRSVWKPSSFTRKNNQNELQFVFNLSQVTSAVSSTYARVTSTSAKKKPEVDVYCSESFLKTLKALEESENGKILKDLQNIKFGPKFEDMQWIFSKDINFRFTAEKSVNKSDFYISLEKNDLKDFYLYFILSKLGSNPNSGNRQKQILTDVENQYLRKLKWNESYVSKRSFDENKQSSLCGNYNKQTQLSNPLLSRLVGTINSYSNVQDVHSVQKRGFKTKRAVDLEEKAQLSVFSRLGRNINEQISDVRGNKAKDVTEKVFESPTMAQMITNEGITPDEKLKLKVSFAEGYMIAVNDLKKPESFLSKIYKICGLIIGFILIGSLFFSSDGVIVGKRKVFNLGFGRRGEIDPEEIDVTFSDVKGVQEVKEELMEIVEFLRDPAKFSSLGGKLPKGVLLVGPPGTGKTLLARAVAGEANVPFFHASGSEFDEIFVGEGARRVRNLFRSAKAKAPSIIFIDEIDCVGSKRKSTMLHPYANQTINQLLSEMDGFNKNEGVIVIGATNRKGDLDSALLRPGRFDVEVLVPLPDLDGRKEILELYMSKILCKDIDILKMARATAGCTGADLEAMINHAAIRAATEGAPYVTMEYLENARDKIMIGPERKSPILGEDALMTAYHEGGHAIVAYFTEGADLVDKVTIVPRGETLGHTSCVPEADVHHVTKARCAAKMDVLLGGRAAEELIFGPSKITVNASSDLEKATSIASNMVKNFGMSEKIGVRTLKNSEGELVNVNEFGQAVTDLVDLEVKRLIQESYERSKNILKKHAKEHKLLAEALVKYKTLNPEDVRAILGDNSSEKALNASLDHRPDPLSSFLIAGLPNPNLSELYVLDEKNKL